MIKLALTDMDDTLKAMRHPRVTDYALDAIDAMLAAGLHFGPVSGRVPDAMSWMFAGREECYATGAFVNGQMVYLDGELVHEEWLDAGELSRVARWACQNTTDATLVLYGTGDGIPSESGHYVTGDPARIERDPQTFGPRDVWAEVPAHDQVKANVFCGGGREHLVQVRDALRSEFPAFDFVLPSNVAPIVDIMPRGWNKGSGVRVLAQALGIGLDEVATFGDSENDLGMIEGFPNSVAVGNASEKVRRAAKWHIGRSEDDAVADALLQIAGAAGTGGDPAFMQG